MSKDPLKVVLVIILTFSISRISCLYNPIIVNSDISNSTEGTHTQNFMDEEINQNGDILENNNSTEDLSDDKYSPVTTTNITKDESDSLEDSNRNTSKLSEGGSPLSDLHEDYEHFIRLILKRFFNYKPTEPSIDSVKNTETVNSTETEITQDFSTALFPMNNIDEEMWDNDLEANNSTELEEFDQSDNSTQNEYNSVTPEYYEDIEDFSTTEETETVNSTVTKIIQDTIMTTEFPQTNSDSNVISWTLVLYRETMNRDNWTSLIGDGHTCKNVGNGTRYSTVKSVNTHNSCIHLYKGRNCEGVFKVSKPGSHCDWNLNACGMTNQVASVSSCSYRNTNNPLLFTTTESARVLTVVEPRRYSRKWQLTLYQGVGNVNRTARIRGDCNQDCQNIGSKKYLRVSSVNTHRNCVRLYTGFNCQGRFEESKPGSTCDWSLDGCQMTNKVASASSCHYSQASPTTTTPSPTTTTTTTTTTVRIPTTTIPEDSDEEVDENHGNNLGSSVLCFGSKNSSDFSNCIRVWTVTLFTPPRHKGVIAKISGAEQDCMSLIGLVDSKDVGSISVNADCIRLYNEDSCQGGFAKIESDSDCHNKLGFCGFHDIRSISSCF